VEALLDFHFIRPAFLWGILPTMIIAWGLWKKASANHNWKAWIEPHLLDALINETGNKKNTTVPIILLVTGITGSIALAGPSWEKIPQPVIKRHDSLVVLLDLSPSMLVQDVKPSRLIAARHKIFDLLKEKKEGYTALIAYSGDAHVVSPLSDDNQTISNLLNTLDPAIMPVYGSNTEHAFELAVDLFRNSGFSEGNILLVTDGVTDKAAKSVEKILSGTDFTLTVIGVGTAEGGPIPKQGGSFIKNKQGDIILPKLKRNDLMHLASNNQGIYRDLQLDNKDIQHLINSDLNTSDKNKEVDREFDQWKDFGAVLTPLLLPFVFLLFRRGTLFSLACTGLFLTLLLSPQSSQAFSWDELWLNQEQRAHKAYQAEQFDEAASNFSDPQWKGSASYQNQDFQSAIENFKQDPSSTGQYNLGNSLAKNGDLEKAIAAYESALQLDPDNQSAKTNKELVEKLLEQQQQQSQDQNSQQQDSDSSDSDSSSDKQNQQDSSQQSSSQQDSSQQEQQNAEQQEQQQNNEEQQSQQQQNQQEQDSEKDEKQQQEQTSESQQNKESEDSSNKEQEQPAPQMPKDQQDQQSQEEQQQQQVLEQWLRTVPDDPSGLLRNKFDYYYQQRRMEAQQGKGGEHLNEEQRW